MDSCIFCKIINKDIPGKIVYEDDLCLAFLDLSQTTKGHTLVIPKKHYDHLLDCDDETLAHIMKITKKIAKGYEVSLGAKGFNFLSNTNAVAGQAVGHFHMHIIPRYSEEDTVKFEFTDNSQVYALEEVLDEILKGA